jgi:hypothetical protein
MRPLTLARTAAALALCTFGSLVPPATQDPALRVELNIPAFRIDVWRDTLRVAAFDVAVGTREFPTPRGEYAITEITWNPWWVPPPSEWAREDTVTPPGPRNPMGRVKLRLAAAYYIHGTPLESSVGSAASHGCIRMRNADAIALARLLQESQGLVMSDAELERLFATRTSRVVPLADSIPVALVYRTAEVLDDTLVLHPDIYRVRASREADAREALAAVGGDTAAIDEAALDAVVRASRSRAVRVPLGSIVKRPAAAMQQPGSMPAVMPDKFSQPPVGPSRRAPGGCISP